MVAALVVGQMLLTELGLTKVAASLLHDKLHTGTKGVRRLAAGGNCINGLGQARVTTMIEEERGVDSGGVDGVVVSDL